MHPKIHWYIQEIRTQCVLLKRWKWNIAVPFDNQKWSFLISIPTKGNAIKFTYDENSIFYEGSFILNEFQIIEIFPTANITKDKSSFVYTVLFQRLYQQHLLSTFLQSFLLWLLAYMTLYIDIVDFSNRFMGSVTSLLVLTSLHGSMEDSLPKTAYFKDIDIWFNWFLTNIFLIMLNHVLVDYLLKKGKRVKRINQASMILAFSMTFMFVVLYFSFYHLQV